MSSAPRPIVAPGPTPQGPPGWEEKQQERLSSGQLTNEKQSSNYHDDILKDQHQDTGLQSISHDHQSTTDSSSSSSSKGGLAKVKDKVHKLGEKMSLVPPTEESEHGNSMERSAHRQVSCGVSECWFTLLVSDHNFPSRMLPLCQNKTVERVRGGWNQ